MPLAKFFRSLPLSTGNKTIFYATVVLGVARSADSCKVGKVTKKRDRGLGLQLGRLLSKTWKMSRVGCFTKTLFEKKLSIPPRLPIWVSFRRTGILVVLCLIFFKQKATVPKPMDIDDFYWFVLTNHDLGMVRKSILTLSIQKKTHLLVPWSWPIFQILLLL